MLFVMISIKIFIYQLSHMHNSPITDELKQCPLGDEFCWQYSLQYTSWASFGIPGPEMQGFISENYLINE